MKQNFNTMLLKILAAFLLLSNFAFALQEDKILVVMTDKINNATKILQNNKKDKELKQKEIFEIFDSTFDYELMSKLSLGKQWSNLDSEQQKIFTKSFEARLKASYIDKLYLYTNEKIIVQELTKVNDSRIELPMHIIGDKETFEVIYKLYKNASNEWFIYDVNILGISIIQTYRNQFVGVLQKDSFDDLIARLNKVEAVTK
jgi:phospholipid transport system substrate-binding protein